MFGRASRGAARENQVAARFSDLGLRRRARNARSLAQSPGGTIFVGTDRAGSVYALRDDNKDGKADRVITVVSGLNTPNGVAFRDGSLYVAEINRVLRFDNIEPKLEAAGAPVVVTDKFPSDRHHGWKFIRFGPDGLLYVPVGAPATSAIAAIPTTRSGA